MSSNNDWLFPSRDKSWDILDDNGLSEDSSSKNISDGSVWTFPHTLKVKLLDSCLIRSNGGALDANLAFLDGLGSFKCNFIFSGIPMLDSQIKVEDVEIKERKNKLILDGFPNDSCHLIPIKFSNRLSHFYLCYFHKILYLY